MYQELVKKINFKHKNFQQFEFLPAETLGQKIKGSDLVIARAGGSVFEIFEAKKPSIIIPLPSSARNHQYINAKYLEEKNLIKLLEQNVEASAKLVKLIESTILDKEITKSLQREGIKNNAKEIAEIILTI